MGRAERRLGAVNRPPARGRPRMGPAADPLDRRAYLRVADQAPAAVQGSRENRPLVRGVRETRDDPTDAQPTTPQMRRNRVYVSQSRVRLLMGQTLSQASCRRPPNISSA